MDSFVEQLYFNKISACNRSYNKNEKTMEVIKEVVRLEDKLVNRVLQDGQKEVLFDFMKAFTELASITVNDVYSVGFREGSKFTCQVLGIDENNIKVE